MEFMNAFLPNGLDLSEAWKASCNAYKHKRPFFVKYDEGNNFVFIAFPGSKDSEDFITDRKFGQCAINTRNQFFSSLKRITTGEAGLVHEGFLRRFLHILQNSNFEDQVLAAQRGKKIIVFTGHSVGGAIASLATLWILEKRQNSDPPPFCVTFGSPLIGDGIFTRAIRRENWAAKFCHVVSRHDIVPRIFLAPLKSIAQPLKVLLSYWWKSMTEGRPSISAYNTKFIDQKAALPEEESCKLLSTVMQHTSAVANYSSAACMAPTNMLLGGITNVVKQSPYRPFGYYVFCSSSGAVCMENHEAVLQMLYYTLQSSDLSSLPLTADACISEHSGYGSTLLAQNVVSLEDLSKLGISDATSSIAIQLEALGLGTQNVNGRLALLAAGEAAIRLRKNNEKIDVEFEKVQSAMAGIEGYRKSCKFDGLGYYDSFKLHSHQRDFQANLDRLKLAGFWDEVIEMVSRQELPDDFESQNKWIIAGTAYRRLVEPLDIANYYRLGKHEDSGHYLVNGRPRRYKTVEKWLEEKGRIANNSGNRSLHQVQPPSLTADSCFWAYLEEISYSFANLEEGQEPASDLKSKLQNFENLAMELIGSHSLSDDVLLDESGFVKWWKMRPNKMKSPLFHFMEGGGRKSYCTVTRR